MPDRFNRLADYNAERARGLVHTPEWQAQMAVLQAGFDRWQRDRLRRQGLVPLWTLPGGGEVWAPAGLVGDPQPGEPTVDLLADEAVTFEPGRRYDLDARPRRRWWRR